MRKIFLSLAIILFLIIAFNGHSWAPTLCIDIEKEVSIDGGATWHDADTPTAAPETAVGQGVEYRLIVTNCGGADLDVTINDAGLGIVNHAAGSLAPSAVIELDSNDLSELYQPRRCDNIGEKENIAYASGSATSGTVVEDNDPAWVKCLAPPQPCIDIEKLISVDGGITWYDADTEAEAVETEVGQGAQYKLIINNCGSVDLKNVAINDDQLGIVDVPVANLAAGDSIELDSGDIPRLDQPERCAESGPFENIARVNALSVSDDFQVTDSDPAWVRCYEVVGGEGCTPGYWKQGHHFDSWASPYTPETLFSDVFEDAFPGKTLLEVLGQGGGHLIALGRHTVAALLNAASSGVSYDLTVDEVVEGFNDVFPGGDYEDLKDYFEDFNEQGCPLNHGGEGKDKDDHGKKGKGK